MRYSDFAEQGTVAPTSTITGNVAQLQDPRVMASTMVQQQQQKSAARTQIMKQIQDLQKQITALRSQQAQIR